MVLVPHYPLLPRYPSESHAVSQVKMELRKVYLKFPGKQRSASTISIVKVVKGYWPESSQNVETRPIQGSIYVAANKEGIRNTYKVVTPQQLQGKVHKLERLDPIAIAAQIADGSWQKTISPTKDSRQELIQIFIRTLPGKTI